LCVSGLTEASVRAVTPALRVWCLAGHDVGRDQLKP
jgi:hypothetical protein